ncbi:MAG: acyl-CoA synthetase [Solirubrobacteraceae bacterium]
MESQPSAPGVVQRVRAQALGDLLRRSALRYPGKLALVSGEVRWSYAEFDEAVDRTAAALGARGVEKGDRLALLSHNCWQFAVLNFALARLGVILVPVNFMLGADEIAYILQHSGASGFITEDGLHPVALAAIEKCGLAGGVRGWINLTGRPVAAGWEDLTTWAGHRDDRAPEVIVADDDPLRLMYTSGTEARPKGVLHSSRSLIAQYVSCIVDGGMEARDIEVHSLPLYHCAQLDCFLGPDVYLGATSIILPRPDPDLLLSTIESERATKLFAPPTVWISLLRSPAFDATDLSSLRKGYYGASAMPVEVLREIQQRLPDVRLWNFYGQTEMAPLATILQPEEQVSRAGSAGRPAVNVETKLVDDDKNEVPAGTIGEIVHRSPHATLGYWNDKAKTAEAFRSGWFHSGDLGTFDEDGYLFVVDRKKDMIKTGGENVASLEVEQTIYLMEGVSEVAVFGITDPKWIEVVVAAVVPTRSGALSSEAVIAHCRSTLAGYKTPKHVVILDSLPKSPSGKILKRDLRKRYADLIPPSASSF